MAECNYTKELFKSIAIVLGCLMFSIFIHEIGHFLAFCLIGIPSKFFFDIWIVGPVVGVRSSCLPTTIPEMVFVIVAGPGVAAIVFALLGRFWRTECYVAAVYQACYVPFELLTWMLGIQRGDELLSIFLLWFVILIVPVAIVTYRIFDRILEW